MIAESQQADIVIVSTNSAEPVLRKEHVISGRQQLFIDLSIPNNIDTTISELSHIKLINVDDLSKINDATLQKRKAELPKANAILAESVAEMKQWCINRRHVPLLKAVKQKLIDMHECNLLLAAKTTQPTIIAQPVNIDAIQKVINTMAVKMRCINQPGCNYIEAINDYIGDSSN